MTMTTRNQDISLESGEYVPVGYIWKFDLDFGDKKGFLKKSNG